MKVLSRLPPTHYHLCPRCLNLLELQVVYVCVCWGLSPGAVRRGSSQILSLGHMGSSPSGWLMGSVLAAVDRKTLSGCRGHDD